MLKLFNTNKESENLKLEEVQFKLKLLLAKLSLEKDKLKLNNLDKKSLYWKLKLLILQPKKKN